MKPRRCSRLVWLALSCALGTLGACEFDPYGPRAFDLDGSLAPVADAAPDASAPDAAADASVADAAPDAATPDAAPPDATSADAEVPPVGCGDGFVVFPEQCDDHNTHAGDGCSPTCRWEPIACYPGAPLAALVPGVTTSGSTVGQASGLSGGATCGGASVGEDVYTFELAERADVIVTTALPGTSFNTAVYVRTDCDDPATQLDCASQAPLGDVLSLPSLPAGSYFAVVDGFGSAAGSYQIELTVRPIRSLGDACDPFGEASRCDSGLSCVATDSAGHGVCAPATNSCAGSATVVALAAAGANVQHGTTSGANLYAPHCAATGSGAEKVFRATVPPGGERDLVLEVRGQGALDPIAELSAQCEVASSSLACSAAAGGAGSAEVAVVDDVAPGDYFAVVDGQSGTSGGFDADFYLRPVVAAGASCDPRVRASRCAGSAVCIDTDDSDLEPSCTNGVDIVAESNGNNASCAHADGPESDDFVYSATLSGTGDVDVVELAPQAITGRIVASVVGPGGTCPVDLALELAQGECGEESVLATSADDGLGPCPYIEVALAPATLDPLFLTITRASNFGSGSYTLVVDFIP